MHEWTEDKIFIWCRTKTKLHTSSTSSYIFILESAMQHYTGQIKARHNFLLKQVEGLPKCAYSFIQLQKLSSADYSCERNTTMQELTFSAMSSIPFAVKTTLAPALRSFSMRSFVMSASLWEKSVNAKIHYEVWLLKGYLLDMLDIMRKIFFWRIWVFCSPPTKRCIYMILKLLQP